MILPLLERTKSQQLIDKLDQIPLGRMYQASFKAAVRLHLYFTGRTHEMMLEFSDKAQALVLKKAGKAQVLDGTSGYIAQTEILKLWGDTFKEWSDELRKVQLEALSIPFGVMAVFHERLVMPVISGQQAVVSESLQDGVFSPQLQILLDAAENRFYGDSLNLSQRIWRLDRETRDGINSVLMNGI